MTQDRPLLLLTRPKDSSRRFLQQLDSDVVEAVDVVISPFMSIVPMETALDLGPYAGVIFTSSNGVAATANATDQRDQTAYCVGPATTAAARNKGWHAVQTGRTADDLVAALIERPASGPLLHLRGQHARGSIAERLTRAGLDVSQQIVYNQTAQRMTDATHRALQSKRTVVVPLFSPRSAILFAKNLPAERPVIIAALSTAVADKVADLQGADVQIAETPDAHAMARLVEKLVRALVSG